MMNTVILTPGGGFLCAVTSREVTPLFSFSLLLLNSSQFSDKSTMTFKFTFHKILPYIKRSVYFYNLPHVLYLYKLSAMKGKLKSIEILA